MANRESFGVEEPGRPSRERLFPPAAKKESRLSAIVAVVLSLAFVCGLIWYASTKFGGTDGTPSSGEPTIEAKPPWWILADVIPAGLEKDMGSWNASTFSKEQQDNFGIDELGKVQVQSKFDTAIAEQKGKTKTPWWILSHVKPEGALDKAGATTFSTQQQKQFGIDELGSVVDEITFHAALSSLFTIGTGMQVIAPWWIRHNVKPEGLKDMGGWKAVSFSKGQQDQFGIDELGVILDRSKYDAAIEALSKGALLVVPPWWLLEDVVPSGPKKDMGGWTASTFSKEQRLQFSVDEQGTVLDQTKFDAAIAVLKQQKQTQ